MSVSCVALDVEQAVAGFINTSPDGREFTVANVNDYIMSLWNAGCGPIRLNFTQPQLRDFLGKCCNVCLDRTVAGYKIDKSRLNTSGLTQREREELGGGEQRAQSFILFCTLRVDLKTPDRLLDAMGFRFIYREPC